LLESENRELCRTEKIIATFYKTNPTRSKAKNKPERREHELNGKENLYKNTNNIINTY